MSQFYHAYRHMLCSFYSAIHTYNAQRHKLPSRINSTKRATHMREKIYGYKINLINQSFNLCSFLAIFSNLIFVAIHDMRDFAAILLSFQEWTLVAVYAFQLISHLVEFLRGSEAEHIYACHFVCRICRTHMAYTNTQQLQTKKCVICNPKI